MRHVGMVGTTFRRTGQQDLQRFTLSEGDRAAALQALHQACGFAESVYLATCNRVEVVFVTPPDVGVAEARLRLYRFFHPDRPPREAAAEAAEAARTFHAYDGEGAAEHLFMVAASLDSMHPGEAQILGQVKEAHRQAVALQLAAGHLALLFDEAFQAAKKVRSTTRLGAGSVSLVSLAEHLIRPRLAGGGLLVIVGAGEMATQCGQVLAGEPGAGCLFVNRSFAAAEALAQRFGGRAQALASYLAAPPPAAAIVTATAAPQPLVDAAFLARQPPPLPLLVDLSVQRNVDPAAAAAAGATLHDLDGLAAVAARHRAARQAELAEGRIIVDAALESFRRRLVERELGPVVRVLREMYQATLEHETRELFERVLPGCDAEAQQRLRRWSTALVNRLAHVPTVGLKHLAAAHGAEAVDIFLEGVRRDVRPVPSSKGSP